jgi:hypothetical protein
MTASGARRHRPSANGNGSPQTPRASAGSKSILCPLLARSRHRQARLLRPLVIPKRTCLAPIRRHYKGAGPWEIMGSTLPSAGPKYPQRRRRLTEASGKNEISRLVTLAWSCLRESLLSKRSPHGWPGGNPVQKGHEPWPSAHIDLVNFRPIQDRIGINVSDSKCLTREIGLIPKLAIQYVKSLRQILYRCLAPFGADGVPKRPKRSCWNDGWPAD